MFFAGLFAIYFTGQGANPPTNTAARADPELNGSPGTRSW